MLRNEEIDRAIRILQSVHADLTVINVLRVSASIEDYGERMVIYSELPDFIDRVQERIAEHSPQED